MLYGHYVLLFLSVDDAFYPFYCCLLVSWSPRIMHFVDLLCPRISVQYLQLCEKRLVVGLEICAVACSLRERDQRRVRG